MSEAALRQVFAEFGVKWQTAELDEGEKKVSAAESSVRSFAQSGLTDALKAKLNAISPALGKMADNFDKLSPAAVKLAKQVLAAGVTLAAAGLALRKAFEFADEFAAKTEELRDTARDLRVTTGELQGLRHAALQSGVGVDRMASALRKFRGDLNQAERWGNGTTWMLRRLGVQVRDGTGRLRPMADLMGDLSVAFDRIPNPIRRTRVAVRLFGEDGRRLLDVMHGGEGGLAALRDEFEALGGGVTEDAAKASREYTLATNRLNVAQDALRSVLAVSVLPALTWIVTRVKDLVVGFVKLTRGTYLVQVVMTGLAAAGTVAALKLIAVWGPAVLPFVFMAAKIALLVLVFEDLVTWINGGDSALGRLIDKLFGPGTSSEFVRNLKEDWAFIADKIREASEWLARVTGQAEAPALGRLGRPNIQNRRPGAPAPLSPEARQLLQLAPGPRQVQGVGSLVRPVSNTTVANTSNNTFHVTTSDPRLAARETLRLFNEQQRRERDAAHPEPAEE